MSNNSMIPLIPARRWKISVLVAVYNGEKFLPDLVRSFLDQERRDDYDYQMVIVENGSTDGTRDLVLDYDAKHENIVGTYIDVKGKVPAFNRAFELSDGDYITLLGADDAFTPHALKTKIDYMIANNADFASNRALQCNADLVPQRILIPAGEKYITNNLLFLKKSCTACLVGGGQQTLRRKIAERGFPIPDHLLFEDWWLSFIASIYSLKNIGIPEVLSYYRIHGANDNGTLAVLDREMLLKSYKRHIAYFEAFIDYLMRPIPYLDCASRRRMIRVCRYHHQTVTRLVSGKFYFPFRFQYHLSIKYYVIHVLLATKGLGEFVSKLIRTVLSAYRRFKQKQIVTNSRELKEGIPLPL